MITHEYTIICDDLRKEDNQKLILIGMYTGTIASAQLPFFMPGGLTFFTCWNADRPGAFDLKIKLQHLESGKTLIEARAGLNVSQPGRSHVPIKLAPIQFAAVGMYNLVFDVEGQKDPVIVEFNVQLNLPQYPQMPMGR
jgi:hypothetical protein